MTGMQFIGPMRRARDLRSAANRLRWEIYCAKSDRDVEFCLNDLAEAIAILTHVSQALNEKFPEGTEEREMFASRLAWYTNFHKTPR